MFNEYTINKAKEYYSLGFLYLPLSSGAIDFENGTSVPFIGQTDSNKNIIFLYSTYERAKLFLKNIKMHIVENIYPISRITKTQDSTGISPLLTNAVNFGINEIYFDYGYNGSFFQCNIIDFIKINLIRLAQPKIAAKTKNFSFLPIHDYSNPFLISNDRKKIILDEALSSNAINYILNEQSLHENCFAYSYIHDNLVEDAKSENDNKSVDFYLSVCEKIKESITLKIKKHNNIFTLLKNNKLLIENKTIYLIYTEMFSNQSINKYRKIVDTTKFVSQFKDEDVSNIIVTNGPDYQIICTKNDFIKKSE